MQRLTALAAGTLTVFLVSCSLPANPLTGSGSVRDVLQTASGFVMEASRQAAATIELGKMGLRQGKDIIDEAQKRAGEFKEGIDDLQKGKELLKKSVTR